MKQYKILLVIIIMSFLACEKSFLEKKPKQALLVPTKLADFQALLDNLNVMNVAPALNLLMSDEIQTTDAGWSGFRTPVERNVYLWNKNPYEGTSVSDWNIPYTQIFYANIILEGLDKINKQERQNMHYNSIKGSALFFRAFALFNACQIFTKPYEKSKAKTTLGLPLRLSSDVNIALQRSSLEGTYTQIFKDLNTAYEILPESVDSKSRPSKAAASALLARVYLSIGNYEEAKKFADSSISFNDKLIDFNTLSSTSNVPFPNTLPHVNDEVIFYNYPITYSFVNATLSGVHPSIIQSYEVGDLRKLIFLRDRGNGIMNFKGYSFSIATPEMYLIRAECNAREGNVDLAIRDLNKLLKSRWTNTMIFNDKTSDNKQMVLDLILKERKKELLFKGLRWSDLRRLNLDPQTTTLLERKINGNEYQLLPNSEGYVLPIPDNEIQNSGIEQN